MVICDIDFAWPRNTLLLHLMLNKTAEKWAIKKRKAQKVNLLFLKKYRIHLYFSCIK